MLSNPKTWFLIFSSSVSITFAQDPASVSSVEAAKQRIQELQSQESVAGILQTEKNPNIRSEIIKNLDQIGHRFGENVKKNPAWVSAALIRGLHDKHVYVVETTVRKIGELKTPGFAEDLISLYVQLPKRFANSPTPMQREIIRTLGRLNGKESADFLIELVNNRTHSELTDEAIKAMGSRCKPLYISTLTDYVWYWESALSAAEAADKAKGKSDSAKADVIKQYARSILRQSITLANEAIERIRGGNCDHE